MVRKKGWVMATGLAGLALVIGLIVWLTSPAPRTCHPRKDDSQGYLFKICLYIQEKQINVSPANPSEYRIKKLKNAPKEIER